MIGATEREGSVGRTILENLVHSSYRGPVFAVNPKRPELLGTKCYPSVAALPEPVDLAVIITPAVTVPGAVRECVNAGTRSAIVISAGFKERGLEGVELERLVQAEVRRGSMRLVGPNCLGMMNPSIGLNATFAHDLARPGNVAFLSQSGALLTTVLGWSLREQVGFSAIVSTGSMLDVNWGDLISFYGEDPQTKSILLYIQSHRGRALLSLGRTRSRVEQTNHRHQSRTDRSHLEGCFIAHGRYADLFYMAEVLSKQPRPRGPRLTIVTNAGGPGVLATDALIPNGGELTPCGFLPSHWSHANPIDILGDADPELFEKAVRIAISDPSSDGLLVILAPQGMTDPAEVARRLAPYAKGHGKPVLASWMGGQTVAEGEVILNAAGIPTFAFPDTTARAFDYMWSYSSHLRALYETPAMTTSRTDSGARLRKAKNLIDRILATGRTLLTEVESKELLSLYGIPSVPTRVARTADEAVAHAAEFGYPAVLKVYSKTITHKTDVGGVKLDLPNAAAVRKAFRSIQPSVRSRAGKNAFQGVTVQPMIRLDVMS